MLDRGNDQAAGLRRAMPTRGGRVLPVAGAGEHPDFVVRLSQALADNGTRVTVVSDFDAVIEQLGRARPRRGLTAIPSLHTGDDLQRLTSIAERAELTLVAVDDGRLARGLSLPTSEAVVLAGADTEALATAYARIKAMVGLGSIRAVCALFGRGIGAPRRLEARDQLMVELGASYCRYHVCIEHTAENIAVFFDALDPIFGKIKECEEGRDVMSLLKGPICHSAFRRLN